MVRQNRHGHRDALMVLLAYRHGLRAAEVVDLRWEQIDCAGWRRPSNGHRSAPNAQGTQCVFSLIAPTSAEFNHAVDGFEVDPIAVG